MLTSNNNHDIWEIFSLVLFPFQVLHSLARGGKVNLHQSGTKTLPSPLSQAGFCTTIPQQSLLWADKSHFSASRPTPPAASTELLLRPWYVFKPFLFGYKVSVRQHCSSGCLPWGLRYCWSLGWWPLCNQIKIAGEYFKDMKLFSWGVWCLWAGFIDVKPFSTRGQC